MGVNMGITWQIQLNSNGCRWCVLYQFVISSTVDTVAVINATLFVDDVQLCLSFLNIAHLFDFASVVHDAIYSE